MQPSDGAGFAFQNSKPDSLLKMEEEQKLEKSPLSGNKDTKFSFSFNKRLLGYVHTQPAGAGARACTQHTRTETHPTSHGLVHATHTPHVHTHDLLEGSPGELPPPSRAG